MRKKKWGQNFLINQNIVQSIIKAAKVRCGDSILEIGPGSGILTEALLGKMASVKSVEIDPKWCKYLNDRFHPIKSI